MPNAINPLTIATNIAALSVSVDINGTPVALNIYNLNNFPQAPEGVYCPMMFPKLEYVSGMEAEPQALATGTVRPWNVTYYVNYRVLYSPVSENITIADMLAPMTDLWSKIATAIIQGDISIGAEDSMQLEPYNMGVVNAANETPFYGFDFRVQIMEFLS